MLTTRHHNELPANIDDLRAVIRLGQVPVIQFGSEPTAATLERADEFCRELGSDINIRFFAYGGRQFDSSILRRLPNVANLTIDTMRSISDFGPIAELEKLKRFKFGVFEHPDGQFLKALRLEALTQLTLLENSRRNFDLSPLSAATSLRQLFIQGHDRGIEAVSCLPELEEVSLSGFPKRHDLAFLNNISGLRALFLILGSRASIAEFSHPNLRKLRIILVRLLEDLGDLGRFANLQELEIEDQLRLKTLDIRELQLTKLKILNCKHLARIVGLETQSKLKDLSVLETGIRTLNLQSG